MNIVFDKKYAKEKNKRNKRNKKGYLKGHQTYFDKIKGVCLVSSLKSKK